MVIKVGGHFELTGTSDFWKLLFHAGWTYKIPTSFDLFFGPSISAQRHLQDADVWMSKVLMDLSDSLLSMRW